LVFSRIARRHRLPSPYLYALAVLFSIYPPKPLSSFVRTLVPRCVLKRATCAAAYTPAHSAWHPVLDGAWRSPSTLYFVAAMRLALDVTRICYLVSGAGEA
jgi:hypothetical protein